jgi:xylulokinase
MRDVYLGLDSSTQSLTATAIAIDGARREIIYEESIVFDEAFPAYGTRHGVLPSDDPRRAAAPPLLWVETLDRMFETMAASDLDLTRIRAISGSAQQHGSVYLRDGASNALAALDPGVPLAPQIAPLLSRAEAPIWLDCSTTDECASLTAALGGDASLARLTGSRAYERFTAAQIRRFATADPEGYAATDRIHLVSSFMASLLAGRQAPLEPADASGMNLMDLRMQRWSPAALRATAPDLERRLPRIEPSSRIVGELSEYWQQRHWLPRAKVVAWSGDNPSSLVGLGLIHPGQMAISLGTSDTLFGPVEGPDPDPSGSGHVFASPAGGYMALTCFANGSLARERVRDAYGLDWPTFSRLLKETPPGNGDALMLPWFAPEITPLVTDARPLRYGLDPADAPRNVRAVVEGQMLAMRLHARWMTNRVRSLRATGGAAVNREILQVMADVFDAEVSRTQPRNSASLGAALRAFHADRASAGTPLAWDEIVTGFTEPGDIRVVPDRKAVAAYARLLPIYEAVEASVLDSIG